MFTQTELTDTAPRLHRFAMRLTHNPSDADDLLQSTLLRALEKQHLYEAGTNLFGWTSKIMFNIFASQYRRKSRFESRYDPDAAIGRMSVQPTQEIIFDLKQVKSMMTQLSPDHRQVLILICVHGLQYDEVANILHIPCGTVRSRLSRARDAMETLMQQPPRRALTPTAQVCV